jgi:transposase-like protein
VTRLSDDERAQIVDLYGTGLSIAQVAARIRRSPSAVRCALIDADVPRRPAVSTVAAELRAEVIRLYTVERLSTHAVAEQLGRPQSGVWQILVDAKVPRRPAGWPKDASTRHRAVSA